MTAKQQLLEYVSQQNWTVTHLLNQLQEYGLINDNCVNFSDVTECDAVKALPILQSLRLPSPPQTA